MAIYYKSNGIVEISCISVFIIILVKTASKSLIREIFNEFVTNSYCDQFWQVSYFGFNFNYKSKRNGVKSRFTTFMLFAITFKF